MRIFYSGIELEVSQLQGFDRTPVYTEDQTDYLYTKFTIRAIGLVSSAQIQGLLSTAGVVTTAGMSYAYTAPGTRSPDEGELTGELRTSPAASPPPPPVVGRPSSTTQGFPAEIVKTTLSSPIITDRAIRHWLTTPRRKLIITNHNPDALESLLESPKKGRLCDAKNGPFVDVFSIQMATGDPRMFLVGLQITTFVNECEENRQNFGAFISNRFSQIHDINEDGYLVITTTGRAYFRTDLVYGLMNPDNLRQFLFLPIPNGFHRSNIKVAGNPDSTGLSYSFVDTQQHAQFVVGDEVGATRLTGTYRCGVSQPGENAGTLLGGIERFYNIQFNKKAAAAREERQESQPPVVHHHHHYGSAPVGRPSTGTQRGGFGSTGASVNKP
jgi:hypothetical protein